MRYRWLDHAPVPLSDGPAQKPMPSWAAQVFLLRPYAVGKYARQQRLFRIGAGLSWWTYHGRRDR